MLAQIFSIYLKDDTDTPGDDEVDNNQNDKYYDKVWGWRGWVALVGEWVGNVVVAG